MRVHIAGVVLFVLLGVGLLFRLTNESGIPTTNPDGPTVENPADTKLLAGETVDLKNGNIHLQIPIVRAARPKPIARRSDH